MTNKVDMADICELAHELLTQEIEQKGFKISNKENYTKDEQKIFDKYYNLITEILNV